MPSSFSFKRTIIIHIVGWVLLFSLVLTFLFTREDKHFSLSFLLQPAWFFFAAFYLALFYGHSEWLLPKLYDKGHYLLYALVIAGIIIIAFYFRPYDRLVRASETAFFSPGLPPRRPPFIDILSILLSLAVLSVSMVRAAMKKLNESEKRVMQAEADRVKAELSFLKAQINPHFLFNTLNNIYSLAVTKNDNAPNAIMKLSHMLRYLTDEAENNFVPLQNELSCVQDFIDLQKLRLNEKTNVNFQTEGDISNKKIPPLLFMTFIENAFKYGISNHKASEICIQVTAGRTGIKLRCKNNVMVNGSEEGLRVGIPNARKRLDHLYDGKYLLNILNHDGVFEVLLELTD
jgi:two-component system, LytTR family, sensor kinase